MIDIGQLFILTYGHTGNDSRECVWVYHSVKLTPRTAQPLARTDCRQFFSPKYFFTFCCLSRKWLRNPHSKSKSSNEGERKKKKNKKEKKKKTKPVVVVVVVLVVVCHTNEGECQKIFFSFVRSIVRSLVLSREKRSCLSFLRLGLSWLVTGGGVNQCDQMARLFFNIQPFKKSNFVQLKILPQQCSKLNQIPGKLNPQKIAKDFKKIPKWQNFAKSGHIGVNLSSSSCVFHFKRFQNIAHQISL